MRRILLAAPMLLAAIVAAPAAGATHVSGGRLVDDLGRTVILRGINAMDKVRGADGDLDPDLDDADFARIASIGFNVLRLGTSWAAVEPSPGIYDDAFITRFRAVMDRAHAHGLRVVVDMHQDVWGEALGGNGAPAWAGPHCNVPPHLPLAQTTGQWFMDYFSPDTQAAFSNFWADGDPDVFCTGPVQTRFVKMWTHLASGLRGHPALAGYDLLNEPWPGLPPGAFEVAQLYPFYERLVRAIRSQDPDTTIFFEPPISKSANIPAVPVGAPDANAVYAPHLYTETMYSGGSITTDATTDRAMATEDGAEADAMGVPHVDRRVGRVRELSVAPVSTGVLQDARRAPARRSVLALHAGLQRRIEDPAPIGRRGPHARIPRGIPGRGVVVLRPCRPRLPDDRTRGGRGAAGDARRSVPALPDRAPVLG